MIAAEGTPCMETWCFLGILFSLPHNKADVCIRAASNDSLDYSTSSGLDIEILQLYSGSYIRMEDRILEPEHELPYFVIAGELLVLSTCNRYQMIIRQVDLRSGLTWMSLHLRSGLTWMSLQF